MTFLVPATPDDRATLDNLMQLYAYDFSERGHPEIGADGRFSRYPLEAYFAEDWRHPFLITVDGKLAGFALIASRSRLTGAAGILDMAEFFVLRAYRRKGVGMAAAWAAFDRFPGRWELRQRVDNSAATAFWRRAIKGYTGGDCDEIQWNNETWTGPVQTFTASPSPRR